MRKFSFVLCSLLLPVCLYAQNVGINTNTPQATLDVRGNQRIGGINNYLKYDSATGKIEWVGAALFTPVSQQIIKHSASAEGLYAGGGKLDYRNSTGNPVFFSDWTTGNGYFSGNVGIGAINPSAYGHGGNNRIVEIGNLNIGSDIQSHIIFSSNGTGGSMGGITWAAPNIPGTEKRVGFIGNVFETSNAARIVFYTRNEAGNLAEKFTIRGNGNVGIGITNPQYPLEINGRMRLSGANPFYPGTWLNDASSDIAFIGLKDNNHVGFYGSGGTTWGFTMNTITGALALSGSEGSPGQVLLSNGSGAAASWGTPAITHPYSFTIIPSQFSSLNGVLFSRDIDGVNNTPFTLNQSSTVIYTLTLPVSGDGPSTLDSKGYVVVEIVDASLSRVSYASSDYYIKRATATTQTASGAAINLPAGNYTIKARLVRVGGAGDGDVSTHASFNVNQQGIQFIAQVLPN